MAYGEAEERQVTQSDHKCPGAPEARLLGQCPCLECGNKEGCRFFVFWPWMTVSLIESHDCFQALLGDWELEPPAATTECCSEERLVSAASLN